jgi:hypothetical protein
MANLHGVSSGTDVPMSGNTTETVVGTCTAFTIANPGGQGVRVSGVINFTQNTNGTGVTVRVRRDSLVGTLVGEAQLYTLAAAAAANIPFDQVDALLAATNQVYVVTLQPVAATAIGTANSWTIGAQAATAVE